MSDFKFTCSKCGFNEYEIDEFRATGGYLTKVFDIQNKKFTTVSCRRCHFTEIYKADSSMLGNIFDFLAG